MKPRTHADERQEHLFVGVIRVSFAFFRGSIAALEEPCPKQ
jgi:hypothetical protein